MRVLNVISAYPPSTGGAQLHAHWLNKHLALRGVHVEVATVWRSTRKDWLRGTTVLAPGTSAVDELDGIAVHSIGLRPAERVRAGASALTYYATPGRPRDWLVDAFLPSARRVVDAARPDVIHMSRIGREGFYEAFLRVASERRIPTVLTPNHHPHWTRRRDAWWWSIYRHVDKVLVLSDYEGDAVARGGVDPTAIRRTVVGPVGEPPATTTPLRSGTGGVVFLGQVKRYKGLDLLWEAWPAIRGRFPDAQLHVAGPWVDGQRRLRAALDAEPSCVVYGAVDDTTKWDVLSAADVLCVPSSEESLGGVYLEGWLAGLAAVGADIPPVRELFARTGGGVTVARDPAAIAETLCRLLGDEAERRGFAERGADAVAHEYNWHVAAQTAMDTYAEITR